MDKQEIITCVEAMKAEATRDMLGEGFDATKIEYATHAGVSQEDNPLIKTYIALEDHAEDGKCLRDDEQCECTAFNWEEPCRCLEPDPDEAWERMRDERND